MTSTENEKAEFYDQGLQSAFEQQAIAVPDHMDSHILKTASDAVNVPYERKPIQRRLEKFRPLLATAAVLMIGVGLLPIILENPESAVSYGLGLNDKLTKTKEINTESLATVDKKIAETSQASLEDETARWLESDEPALNPNQVLLAPDKAPAINGLEQTSLNPMNELYPVGKVPTETPSSKSGTDKITSVAASRASIESNEVSTLSFRNVANTREASGFNMPHRESSYRWINYIEVLIDQQKLEEAIKEFEWLQSSDLDLTTHQTDQILTRIRRLEDFLTEKNVTQ